MFVSLGFYFPHELKWNIYLKLWFNLLIPEVLVFKCVFASRTSGDGNMENPRSLLKSGAPTFSPDQSLNPRLWEGGPFPSLYLTPKFVRLVRGTVPTRLRRNDQTLWCCLFLLSGLWEAQFTSETRSRDERISKCSDWKKKGHKKWFCGGSLCFNWLCCLSFFFSFLPVFLFKNKSIDVKILHCLNK